MTLQTAYFAEPIIIVHAPAGTLGLYLAALLHYATNGGNPPDYTKYDDSMYDTNSYLDYWNPVLNAWAQARDTIVDGETSTPEELDAVYSVTKDWLNNAAETRVVHSTLRYEKISTLFDHAQNIVILPTVLDHAQLKLNYTKIENPGASAPVITSEIMPSTLNAIVSGQVPNALIIPYYKYADSAYSDDVAQQIQYFLGSKMKIAEYDLALHLKDFTQFVASRRAK